MKLILESGKHKAFWDWTWICGPASLFYESLGSVALHNRRLPQIEAWVEIRKKLEGCHRTLITQSIAHEYDTHELSLHSVVCSLWIHRVILWYFETLICCYVGLVAMASTIQSLSSIKHQRGNQWPHKSFANIIRFGHKSQAITNDQLWSSIHNQPGEARIGEFGDAHKVFEFQ